MAVFASLCVPEISWDEGEAPHGDGGEDDDGNFTWFVKTRFSITLLSSGTENASETQSHEYTY